MQTHRVGDKASLSGIRRRLRADLARAGVDPAKTFDCLVAVTEACTNALLHGTRSPGATPPVVGWEIDGDAIRFSVRDFSGHPWSARAAHPSSGDGDRIGGFGLELMRGLMDAVDIRIDAGGTVVELTKRLS